MATPSHEILQHMDIGSVPGIDRGTETNNILMYRVDVNRSHRNHSKEKLLLLIISYVFIIFTWIHCAAATTKDTWWRLGVDGPWRTSQLYLSSSSVPSDGDQSLAGLTDGTSPIRFCMDAQGPLSPGQLKLCYLYPDHMPAVSRGARIGLQECQWQFKHRRWNCSFIAAPTGRARLRGYNMSSLDEEISEDDEKLEDQLSTEVTSGALVSNSSKDSQGSTHTRRRRAARGSNVSKLNIGSSVGSSVTNIGSMGSSRDVLDLDNEMMPPPNSPLFGHVIDIASPEAAFTHAVLSAGVSHAISRACRDGELSTCGCSPRSRPRSLPEDWLWGGCGDNTVYGYRFTQNFVDIREREKNFPRHSRQLARMLMNLHNNEAGRRAVYSYSKVACKCHGVSGSCNLRTCWNQLAPFRQTGDRLKMRYDSATQVTFNQQGTYLMQRNRKFNKPTKEDLIYIESSPDYCLADPRTGHPGTYGRRCDRTSMGIEGCGLLCCGRGYNSRDVQLTERCQCKFEWCCKVKCKICQRIVTEETCK